MSNIKQILSVYFIAGTQDCLHCSDPVKGLLDILEQALQAGITCFQFRDKGEKSLESQPEKQKSLAIQCRDLCHQYQVPFIINDNVQLAIEIDADGIHVGQQDMSITDILANTTRKFILGLTTNNLAEILKAKDHEQVDYLGVGPIFPTRSKANHSPAVGMALVSEIKNYGITKPFVVIGGINETNAYLLRQLGADGVAVISAITQSTDMMKTVQDLASPMS